MSRYIDAEQAVRAVAECFLDFDNSSVESTTECNAMIDLAIDKIKEQPTADARENVKGEWIPLTVELVHDLYGEPAPAEKLMCSFCSFTFFAIDGHSAQYHYCPNCGADMREGDAR